MLSPILPRLFSRTAQACRDCGRCLERLHAGAWRPACPRVVAQAPENLRSWITWPGSMTKRLEATHGMPIAVEVVFEGRGEPRPDEARLLGKTARPALVREVVLRAGAVPVLTARTILPLATATGINHGLLRLGNRPLGAILFQSPGVRWETREMARDEPGRWGRRTVYLLKGRPLLVAEFFQFN
ncbi:MAG: chorismate lyase, partial [Rhodospirillales bacterium]|nr:chorismate lyase [Rhodospirillales bacterium]